MEIKVKYQYTYFLYPYNIEKQQYKQYICHLLKEKNCNIKIFEKERDLDIYTYFKEELRQEMFPSFEWDKSEKNSIQKKEISKVQKILEESACTILEYSIGKNVQGKMGEQNGIFFKIPKIEIICFATGMCFLSIKTYIEGSESWQDVLNFNYKFRDVHSEFSKLKEYENIKIQTDIFENMDELKAILYEITGQKRLEQKFFTYTYACVDSEVWNNEENKIGNEFMKYAYVLPNDYKANFSEEHELKTLTKWKYMKIGVTKQCSSLLASNIDTINYTKIPFTYENEYLYTVIYNLYRKLYYEKMLKTKDEMEFIKEWEQAPKIDEITYDETGEMLDQAWKENLKIVLIYKKLEKRKQEILGRKNWEKSQNTIKLLTMILIASIIINIVNLLSIIGLMLNK